MAKVLPTKKTERAGVNQFRALLESAGHIVQEIDGGNDYGEDCYLSFTERGERTGDLVAVQVKSGVKYRRSVGYAIPCRDHVEDWTRSRIPVIGVVYDPDLRKLFWVNLTRYLREQLGRGKRPRSVPIAEDAVLDAGTLSSVVRCMREFIAKDDVRVAHERGLVSHLRSSLRSRGSRSFREVEDVPIGGKPFTMATAWVDFEERHPKFQMQATRVGFWLMLLVLFAMQGAGLYEAAESHQRTGWIWLIAYYGLVVYLIQTGFRDPGKRRAALVRSAGYLVFLGGWYVGVGRDLSAWPVPPEVEWFFVAQIPVIGKFTLLYLGFYYVRQEMSRRRRLRAVYGEGAPIG
ncbi:DUF4365 domain-containing protein [Streptomyces sp. NPDC059578]|uniref:DUF4365 domain-containing protein n=1 Tax=Streptomyces sp. NPDC059578 TaxID=3346874 RepID=UPI0036A12564